MQRWLSILESGYIVYLLPPFSEHFNKRLVKSPKLYFCDTGLAAYLPGIYTEGELTPSHFRGALFENAVINEYQKLRHQKHPDTALYYWRDQKGLEVDLIVEKGGRIIPVEIKSSQTFSKDYLRNIVK